MDLYSGSYPLKFISFRLDMSNEENLPESTNPEVTPDNEAQKDLQEVPQETTAPSNEIRPESQASNLSCSTDESVTAFIERTVSQFPSSQVTALDPLPEENPQETVKSSESDPLAIAVLPLPTTTGTGAEETRSEVLGQKELFSDTSDPGELYDSSGVELPTAKQGTFTFDPDLFPSCDEELQHSTGNSDAEQATYRAKVLSAERQLSPTGKEVIRKFFSESQVHAILRTVADESVLSSFHMEKSLLVKVTEGIQLNKRPSRNIPRRSATPGPGCASSSGGESSGTNSDGYTSGAIDTNEDLCNIDTGSEGFTPVVSASKTLNLASSDMGLARALTPNSGSSYSSGDYRPLASLTQGPALTTVESSPPRKRRKKLCKPGKVMKDAYFKGIQWTRTFVSGPLDPLHNRYKFYCQICKTNISIYSKGAREILRHYKTQGHLRRDQRWRYEHLSEVDSTTGKVTYQVRGKDGYILTPLQLEKEKPLFIDAPLVDIGDKFPFYDDSVATLGGKSNPDELRMTTQISLIGTFVPRGGDLSLLRNLWTQFGVFTSHQGFFSDFDWQADNLTVSITSPT